MDLEDVETIAVLGAGNMGHGIAEVAALAGYDVYMRDIEEELVEDGYQQIEWSLGKLAEKDQISEADADAALDRIDAVVDLGRAVGDADVVIEAVPERMEIKKDVYAEVAEYAPDRTIFATNTSSLSVSELARTTDRPEQFCGMHFFNPPVRMQLVEVVRGQQTAEATLTLIEELAEELGKTPIRVQKDTPGFVVNRVLVPLMNEAAWIVESDDATVAEVDSTAKYDLGLPMGAFELADEVGIDVGYHILEYMHDELGDAYEPCPLLEEKVEAGQLGKKSGSGFYDYEDGGADIPADAGSEAIRKRLLAVMANEVAALVGDNVADPATIDRAITLGAGFPEGPARLADETGIAELVETLDHHHQRTDADRYEAVQLLRELAATDEGFYSTAEDETDEAEYETLRVEYDGRVVRIVVDRAHRMNTLTPAFLDELDAVLDRLEADEEARAILLTGAGDRAFSAGVDVQAVAAGGADAIEVVELARKGQRVFDRLRTCPLPVVAAIDGYCLGGGMELATAADLRVASQRSEFGQPELNLGLIPGWGGTQRLRRIVGDGRAREIILTADRYDAETMAEYGFVNELVANDRLEEVAGDLASDLAGGPPIAQRYAKRAMNADDLETGLELEAQSFGQLMNTEDLMRGITAFMGDEEPEFEGE
jgi:enoyl-CoA hydratase/3-hydroxyacyl-CoA dehydrogenase